MVQREALLRIGVVPPPLALLSLLHLHEKHQAGSVGALSWGCLHAPGMVTAQLCTVLSGAALIYLTSACPSHLNSFDFFSTQILQFQLR